VRLVQLVNCSHRTNQDAELEGRLEKLERAATGAGTLSSDKDPESADPPSNELPGAGKPGTPLYPVAYAKKVASQA
jgi:hypothetical protein